MKPQKSVFILKSKYDDDDTEIAGVYDSYDALVKGFRKLILDQPMYPVPTEKDIDDLVADLGGHGPDDECDFNGCIFSWEERRVHCEEEYNGKTKRDDSHRRA